MDEPKDTRDTQDERAEVTGDTYVSLADDAEEMYLLGASDGYREAIRDLVVYSVVLIIAASVCRYGFDHR